MNDDYKNIDPIFDPDTEITNTELNINTTNIDVTEPIFEPIHTPIERGEVHATFNSDNSNSYQPDTSYQGDNSTTPTYTTPPPIYNTDNPKRKHKFLRFTALFVVFVFLGGVVFGAGYGSALYFGNQLTPSLIQNTQKLTFDVNRIEPVVSPTAITQTSDTIVSSIAKAAGPSVVTVTSTFVVNNRSFFSNSAYEGEGTGSGIIYDIRDNDLLIITNHHVIENANKVEITFHEGISLPAEIIGYDSRMDLAVLSIPLSTIDDSDIEDITVASFGDSTNLEVGELAVAIGNPLGKEFSSTVTAGVISAIGRELNIDGANLTLLQTDAAINPGNSGGALVNSKSEVIGVNTAKYVDESVEGMGFSIPVHLALPVIKNIIDNASGTDLAYSTNIDKPFLGVKISNITDEIYNETGMPFGIYVTDVIPNSAADKAGILTGDVIYSINGQKLMTTDDLFDTLSSKKVGDVIKINVTRGDEVISLEAQLTRYGDVVTD